MRKLILRAAIPAIYTFTSNDRDASFSPSSAANLDFYVVSNYAGDSKVKFLRKNPLRITRARLLSTGAPGVQVPAGEIAASIKLNFNSQGNTLPEFTLALSEWNVWEEKTVSLDMGSAGDCQLSIKSSSEFNVDDFNIQEDFVGQAFTPVLELEVESDSVVDSSSGNAY